MGKGALAKGDYRLRLLMLDSESAAAGQRVFTVSLSSETPGLCPPSATDRVDVFQATGRANRVLERSYLVTVGSAGTVTVHLTPQQGAALLSAAILEPTKVP